MRKPKLSRNSSTKKLFVVTEFRRKCLSDRGTSFLNQVIKELCEKFQTKHRLTSSYKPQTNEMIEQFNQTIGKCIAKLLTDKEKEWDKYIDTVLLAYHTIKHEATGFMPFQLLYGR